jgi:hypothetical protein
LRRKSKNQPRRNKNNLPVLQHKAQTMLFRKMQMPKLQPVVVLYLDEHFLNLDKVWLPVGRLQKLKNTGCVCESFDDTTTGFSEHARSKWSIGKDGYRYLTWQC